ncbi:uncharacterized protein LOC114245109 [Bombyx mandarina]|uniref:Uncharacterized protein LOC114245109 n=1 Tax=Bombyx mandarina TaxID=7092 RepID=A0A6J2JXN0_BOMMA|nr:uncharacterized protein LOC114245109 [Bombyx mandarina]
MELVIFLFVISSLETYVQTLPINNGLSVKFKPISAKEDIQPKTFGALFAKIPQDYTPEATFRREILQAFLSQPPELGKGCTNQIAKITSCKVCNENETYTDEDKIHYINLPIVTQPFEDYKILVATSPPAMKMSYNKPSVIYIVFPDDSAENISALAIPKIYFVNTVDGKLNIDENEKVEPILIIDSNRTVTGIKSREISRFVRFRNKLSVF